MINVATVLILIVGEKAKNIFKNLNLEQIKQIASRAAGGPESMERGQRGTFWSGVHHGASNTQPTQEDVEKKRLEQGKIINLAQRQCKLTSVQNDPQANIS